MPHTITTEEPEGEMSWKGSIIADPANMTSETDHPPEQTKDVDPDQEVTTLSVPHIYRHSLEQVTFGESTTVITTTVKDNIDEFLAGKIKTTTNAGCKKHTTSSATSSSVCEVKPHVHATREFTLDGDTTDYTFQVELDLPNLLEIDEDYHEYGIRVEGQWKMGPWTLSVVAFPNGNGQWTTQTSYGGSPNEVTWPHGKFTRHITKSMSEDDPAEASIVMNPIPAGLKKQATRADQADNDNQLIREIEVRTRAGVATLPPPIA